MLEAEVIKFKIPKKFPLTDGKAGVYYLHNQRDNEMKIEVNGVTPASMFQLFGEMVTVVDDEGEAHIHQSPYLSLCATTEYGQRFIHKHKFDGRIEEDAAWRLAGKASKVGVIDLEYWVETFPVYGSRCWEEEDAQETVGMNFDERTDWYVARLQVG